MFQSVVMVSSSVTKCFQLWDLEPNSHQTGRYVCVDDGVVVVVVVRVCVCVPNTNVGDTCICMWQRERRVGCHQRTYS